MEKVSDCVIGPTVEAAELREVSARAPSIPVHGTLALCSAVMIAFCLLSSRPGAGQTGEPLLIAALVLLAPMLIPAAYWHEHKNRERRDAALMLPWAFVLAALIAQTALIACTYTYPLRDMLWRHWDERLGISLPTIMALATRHPLVANLLGRSYGFVHPMVLCAILLPALMGKRLVAERFLLANAVAFVLALPCMVFLPAVGPWVAWNFAPSHAQVLCEYGIRTLREGAIRGNALFGATVCLPSFHVFWAVVAAYTLQSFRLLRLPAAVLAVLITISTLTMGWHYGVDVIAGLLLAAVCLGIAAGIAPRR